MLETANTQIDIRRLEREIRWNSQKYDFLWSGVDAIAPLGHSPEDSVDTSLVAGIAAAAAVSNVESPSYSMQRYPSPLRWIARFTAKTVLYFARIVTHAQTHFNYHVVETLTKADQAFERIDEKNHMHAGILGWVSDVLPDLGERQEETSRRMTQAESERSELRRGLSNLGSELSELRRGLSNLGSELSSLEQSAIAQSDELRVVLRGMEEKLAHLSSRLSLQERKIAESDPVNSTAKVGAGERDISTGEHPSLTAALDGFYMVFEDHFRGSREDILKRLEDYLPLVEDCLSSVEQEGLVLDLGCGRGEWLELLVTRGVKACGIDNNAGFLVLCEQLKLDVVESDALEYLRSLPDASVSIVSGFHIIEHLRFDVLMSLVDEVQRVLQPGGMVIFETPNPKNLIVGACNFYADPTHVRQIFPDLLEFVMQSRGYRDVELRYLNPHPPAQQLFTEEAPMLAAQLNGLLSCARDFAVVAYK
jgi:O-antigen chain-terminating methyltransferase